MGGDGRRASTATRCTRRQREGKLGAAVKRLLRRTLWALAAVVILAAVLLAAWYQLDGQPRPEATHYLVGDGYRARKLDDGGLLFTPLQANGSGVVVFHGALIEPLSYARTAAFFAQHGYTVYLPRGPLRLSILAVDSAAQQLSQLPIKDWLAIGHSMGGLAALRLARDHPLKPRAVALWAAAVPDDFSRLDGPMLYLVGDRDGLLRPVHSKAALERLPSTTARVTLAGANHQDFAMYTHQMFDLEGTLGWAAQIDRANQLTWEFFTGLH